MRNRSHHAGFTLIELMITISVAAILITVAVPSFRSFMQKNNITSATNGLVSDLNIARAKAIGLGQTIILCTTADPTAASPTCNGTSGNWTTGWLIFVSEDSNTSFDSGTDRLLRISEANTSGVNIRVNNNGASSISYNSDGSVSPTTPLATTVIAVCDERGASYGKQISIKPTGRPRLISTITDCTPT